MRLRSACGATIRLILAAAPAAIAGAGIPDDLEILVEHLGFDTSDLPELLDGEIIFIDEDLDEGSGKEMAASAAVILPMTLDEAVAFLRSDRRLEIDPIVMEFGRLGGRPDESDFARVGYASGEWEEVERLLQIEPGREFNFSGTEIGRLQRLGQRLHGRSARDDPSVRRATNAVLRALLGERYLAYREGGLGSIAPYDRGGDEPARPGQELKLALKEDLAQDRRLAPLARDLHRALASYPDPPPEGVASDFLWTKATVRGRPCFALAHRLSTAGPQGAMVVERLFYVSHNYNSLQSVLGVLPTDQGVFLFLRSRTSTDHVAGLGRVKKPEARRRMRNAIATLLGAFRVECDRPSRE